MISNVTLSIPALPVAGGVLILLVAISIIYPIASYLIDTKGLRKYPAPSFLAACTPLWQMYHNFRGHKYLVIDRVHQELGEVVRLSPTHLSFSSPRAYKDIYGHGITSIVKDVFYDNQAGGNPSMADTTSRELHRNKRKNLAFVFAAKQITAMEPRVMQVVNKLLRDIRIKSAGGRVSEHDRFPTRPDGVFDLRPWMNMFSYDAITNVFWSRSYGFLDRGDDDCTAQSATGRLERVHAMETFHTGAAFSVLLGHMSPLWYDLVRNRLLGWTFPGRCGGNFTGMARFLASERLRDPPGEPDLFSNLPTSATEKRPVPMSMDEIVAESGVMLNAGNDTTQTSLTNTMFDLAAHPGRQDELRRILRASLAPDQVPVAPYESLQGIPYLRAVIDESLRLHPPLSTGLPRRTTAPTSIAGEPVPAGVTVSAQVYTLHRSSALFRDAEGWRPERWLPDSPGFTDAERRNLRDYVVPFSLGPRACIGRNLAYMELSICIAALVMAFEWTLPEAESKLMHHERFNCNPVELLVRAKPLDV